MPLSLDSLRLAARQPRSVRKSLVEAQIEGLKTVFLCHSHRDADLVQGFLKYLDDSGWRVYVDWEDTAMPEQPDRRTALRIQQKIVDLHYFLFLATPNSMNSRWCPWEIGYADGKKPLDQILVVPTTDSSGNWHGNEYLKLYRRIDLAQEGVLGAFAYGESKGFTLSSL
jgi:hypothetical protein